MGLVFRNNGWAERNPELAELERKYFDSMELIEENTERGASLYRVQKEGLPKDDTLLILGFEYVEHKDPRCYVWTKAYIKESKERQEIMINQNEVLNKYYLKELSKG